MGDESEVSNVHLMLSNYLKSMTYTTVKNLFHWTLRQIVITQRQFISI
jgi:hypothetical protein